MFWIRYIATLPIMAALLTAAGVEVARSTWWAGPFQPAGTLVAPDQFTLVGTARNVMANVVPLQAGLLSENRVVWADLPDGRCVMGLTGPDGFVMAPVSPARAPGVRHVTFRLSQESGYGPLRIDARVFVFSPKDAFVAVDLEGTRRFSRYELSPTRREWLVSQLRGRQPVYLADVGLADYNDLRASLQSGRWPDGPLVMWRWMPYGAASTPAWVCQDLLGRLKVELAVVSEIQDNCTTFRQAAGGKLQLTGWPAK